MTDGTAFYGAAVGAIPLLYIALAVEERASRLVEGLVSTFMDDEPQRVVKIAVLRGIYLTVVTGVLLSGAAAAFVGLAHPEWDLDFSVGHTGSIVAVSLIVGGAVLVLQPFLGGVLELLQQTQLAKQTKGVVLGVALFAALIALYWGYFVIWALLH